MIYLVSDADPAVGLATLGTTIPEAQAWVREQDTPVLVPGGGHFTFVHKDGSGQVVIERSWPVNDSKRAVELAHRVLAHQASTQP
jgi:hypothetical protein